MESIVVALITGGLSLAGVVITCVVTSRKSEAKQEISMAVMQTEIKELTREVRDHNGFGRKIPVIEEQIRVINHRIDDLEKFHKPTS